LDAGELGVALGAEPEPEPDPPDPPDPDPPPVEPPALGAFGMMPSSSALVFLIGGSQSSPDKLCDLNK